MEYDLEQEKSDKYRITLREIIIIFLNFDFLILPTIKF